LSRKIDDAAAQTLAAFGCAQTVIAFFAVAKGDAHVVDALSIGAFQAQNAVVALLGFADWSALAVLTLQTGTTGPAVATRLTEAAAFDELLGKIAWQRRDHGCGKRAWFTDPSTIQ
jgi:hypothetical protein